MQSNQSEQPSKKQCISTVAVPPPLHFEQPREDFTAGRMDKLNKDIINTEISAHAQEMGYNDSSAKLYSEAVKLDNSVQMAEQHNNKSQKLKNEELIHLDLDKLHIMPRKGSNDFFEIRYNWTERSKRSQLIQTPKLFMKFVPTANISIDKISGAERTSGHTMRVALLDVFDNRDDPQSRVYGTPPPPDAREGTISSFLVHDKLIDIQNKVVKWLTEICGVQKCKLKPIVFSKYDRDESRESQTVYPASIAFPVYLNRLNITSSSGRKYTIEQLGEKFIRNNPNKSPPFDKFVAIGFTFDRVVPLAKSATNPNNYTHSIRLTAHTMHVFDETAAFEDAEIDTSVFA